MNGRYEIRREDGAPAFYIDGTLRAGDEADDAGLEVWNAYLDGTLVGSMFQREDVGLADPEEEDTGIWEGPYFHPGPDGDTGFAAPILKLVVLYVIETERGQGLFDCFLEIARASATFPSTANSGTSACASTSSATAPRS